MILHNDHSLCIGMGPANTRKHVFKISRARQVPLLASLRPSLRPCARARVLVVFQPYSGIAKELRFSRNSFQVRIASRKLPSKLPRMSSPPLPRSYCVPTFQNACNMHQFRSAHPAQYYARRIKRLSREETYANSRILSTKKFQTSLLQQELISHHNRYELKQITVINSKRSLNFKL